MIFTFNASILTFMGTNKYSLEFTSISCKKSDLNVSILTGPFSSLVCIFLPGKAA